MISDVLSEAIAEIKRYRADPTFARCYADAATAAKLDSLVEHMTAVRVELDTPPSGDGIRIRK